MSPTTTQLASGLAFLVEHGNTPRVTEELEFSFYSILIELNLSSHTGLVALFVNSVNQVNLQSGCYK